MNEVKPATDLEIKNIGAWNCDCSTKGPNHPRVCLMNFGPALVLRVQSLRQTQAQLVEALKVAHDHITGPFGPLGEHRDNPVPSLLREAMLRAEEEK